MCRGIVLLSSCFSRGAVNRWGREIVASAGEWQYDTRDTCAIGAGKKILGQGVDVAGKKLGACWTAAFVRPDATIGREIQDVDFRLDCVKGVITDELAPAQVIERRTLCDDGRSLQPRKRRLGHVCIILPRLDLTEAETSLVLPAQHFGGFVVRRIGKRSQRRPGGRGASNADLPPEGGIGIETRPPQERTECQSLDHQRADDHAKGGKQNEIAKRKRRTVRSGGKSQCGSDRDNAT